MLQHPLLNHPIQKYLAESEFTLALSTAAERFEFEPDFKLPDDDIPSFVFEASAKHTPDALEGAKEHDMEITQANPQLEVVNGPVGSLSSRVRCLAYDASTCPDPIQWRHQVHPAYPLIHQELIEAYQDNRLNAVMDELESIGCVVTYDKSTCVLSLGLSLDKVCGGFTEHSSLMDRRNLKVLNIINGVSPIKLMNDEPVLADAPAPSTPLFVVTFALAGR